MPSRRRLLRGAGAGITASLAGCAGILSGSESTTGDPVSPFLANPSLASEFDVPVDDPQQINATLNFYDFDGLYPHRDHLPTFELLTTIPRAFSVEQGAQEAWLETLSAYSNVHYVSSFGGDAHWYAAGREIRADGDFGIYEYYGDSTLEPPGSEEYRGYDLHLDDAPRLGPGDGTLVGSYVGELTHVEDGEGVIADTRRVETTLLRDAIDRTEDGPTPADWVTDALGRCRPFHQAVVELVSDGDDVRWVVAKGLEVTGAESTYRVAYAAPTAEEFREIWPGERLPADVADVAESDPAFDAGETAGHATVTVPTRLDLVR